MTETRKRSRRSDSFVGEYVNLPLLPGTKKKIDSVLVKDETRSSFIRHAIRLELERRGVIMEAAE